MGDLFKSLFRIRHSLFRIWHLLCGEEPWRKLDAVPELVAGGGRGSEMEPQVAYDGEGTLHVVWRDYVNGSSSILYASKPVSGQWSVPVELSTGPSTMLALATDSENRVHVVWVQDSDIIYTSKPFKGEWIAPDNISGTLMSSPSEPALAVNKGFSILKYE